MARIRTFIEGTCGTPSSPATIRNGNWDFSCLTKSSPTRSHFDVLDATKLIPEEEVPIRRVGRLVLDRCVDNFFAETEQVAFCTNNIVPGVDFSNDPLAARPQLFLPRHPGEASRRTELHPHSGQCAEVPVPQFPAGRPHGDGESQRTGQTMSRTPGAAPRVVRGKSHEIGFRSFPAEETGPKVRERSESFADHYSQARQFYISQTKNEQGHIADALIFELSKVEEPAIRHRMVAHLPHIDTNLAERVASGLGITENLQTVKAAVAPPKDIKKSKALSILLNPPATFSGRKLGALVTNRTDHALVQALKSELERVGATLELVAPTIEGIRADDGSELQVHHKCRLES